MRLPNQTIKRLFRYRGIVEKFQELGYKKVLSADLAEMAGITPDQVRKDFSIFGITGKRRSGYDITDVLAQLTSLLGKNETLKAVLVGMGNIGRALLHYDGFSRDNITISAAFDIDPMKINAPRSAEVEVLAMTELANHLKRHGAKIGIIAVPSFAAQQVADELIKHGIKGLLNFAPVSLKTPDDVYVATIDVGRELETLGFYVRRSQKERK